MQIAFCLIVLKTPAEPHILSFILHANAIDCIMQNTSTTSNFQIQVKEYKVKYQFQK